MSALERWAGVGTGTCPTAVISRESLRAQSRAAEQRLAFCFGPALIAIPETAVLQRHCEPRCQPSEVAAWVATAASLELGTEGKACFLWHSKSWCLVPLWPTASGYGVSLLLAPELTFSARTHCFPLWNGFFT